ncbi:MAG: aminotransferase DegT, partial [Candidatus Aenigmarchaeota archaeon]|nr:aminotransferase DegT [Candidatus Aenigmarchaeota archaeon]
MIPISKPSVGEEEIDAIKRVIENGFLGLGKEVKKFEEEFSSYISTKFGVATNNGTSALHTALASLGIKEGDEVITTTLSFIATATCILMQNAKPVFCDIDPKTYNVDPDQVKEEINEKTKAIIVVHLFGQPCEMKPILEIAEERGIPVI